MMQPHLSSNTAVPITSNAGILNLDHYKYLRSLLPTVPHFIESLSFTDLNNWECQIYVNLLTESDCLKWLGDFEDRTNTGWKADPDSANTMQLTKGKGSIWQMVYRCIPSDSKKDCPAKLEMKIVGQDEAERNSRSGKQYPCQVSINFYHNHNTTNSNVLNMETFKSQDIPSHLKEGFEGYFQETMQPVNSSVTTTVNLNAIKPQHTLLNSPLTHTLANNAQVVIKAEVPLSPVGQHLDGKLLNRQDVVDLHSLSTKLDNTLEVLKRMLKQPGTGAASVKQFVDKFEKLESDQSQLEDALTSFGGQWDWLVSTDSSQAQTTTSLPQIITSHHPASTDLSPKKGKKDRKKLDDKDPLTLSSPVFSTNIVNGQIILQQQQQSSQSSDTPGPPDSKKRKRARCGNCSGCLNRDKTQDCRQCRNCLDQKRYGGPGRLKKACIKRQCVVISQIGSSDPGTENKAGTVAVKSEPVYSIKSEPVTISSASVPVSGAQTVAAPVTPGGTPTILSWPPGTPYTPGQTFQVQVQQPVQFAFQPTTFATGSGGQIQYSTVQPAQIQQLTTTQLGAV